MIEPVQVSFEVACDPRHAFDVWTSEISAWWPPDHTVSGDPAAIVVIEPRVGGRIFERTPAGQENDWGEVTAWEPPARLAYTWHIGADPTEATDIEVEFVPVTGSMTRVDVLHRGWEHLGDRGLARRDTNRAGWDALIPAYRARCAGGAG